VYQGFEEEEGKEDGGGWNGRTVIEERWGCCKVWRWKGMGAMRRDARVVLWICFLKGRFNYVPFVEPLAGGLFQLMFYYTPVRWFLLCGY
jgi:hypothetical protein